MELQSLAFACATFQRDPRLLEAAIAAIQAERAIVAGTPRHHEAVPAMVLNDKRYYRSDEIIDAVTWLSRHDAEDKLKEASRE